MQTLRAQIEGLEKHLPPARLGLPKSAERAQYLAMLRSLAALWGRPPARRYPRSLFHPRVEVVLRFDPLWQFIARAAFQRRNDDPPPYSAPGEAPTTWAIVNESADGFALRHLTGKPDGLSVGELLMLRRGDNAAMQVCAVRRAIVVSGTLFLGVQLIGARPTTAMLALPEPGNAVRSGHRLNRVIFLPKLPGCAGAPGLLTKPNDLPADVAFAVPHAGRGTV